MKAKVVLQTVLFQVLLLCFCCEAAAELLGRISEESAPFLESENTVVENKPKILYRVICSAENSDDLPECGKPPIEDNLDIGRELAVRTSYTQEERVAPAGYADGMVEPADSTLKGHPSTSSTDKLPVHKRGGTHRKNTKRNHAISNKDDHGNTGRPD